MNNSPPFGNQAKYKTQFGQRVKTTILEVHAPQARTPHGPPFEERKRARGRFETNVMEGSKTVVFDAQRKSFEALINSFAYTQ